ncbi:MAG: lipopolysaccharide core heptose(I) kinase RfaP [Pseudomonadales bacterium]
MADAYLRPDVAGCFGSGGAEEAVTAAWAMKGELVRDVARRQTLRVMLDGRPFYLKRHRGVGWIEVLKNAVVGKRPVLGARNEFEACRHLERAGLKAPVVAAFAETGGLPAGRSSFVLTDALVGYEDLESLTSGWLESPPDPLARRRLVLRVADFARRFHDAGLVHRDFYLCHLLLPSDPQEDLAVLDLHRALIFAELPDRWRKRDLAALLFSALDLPVGCLSWLRFVRRYCGRPLPEEFAARGDFWREVYERACRLYAKGMRKGLSRGRFQQ